MKKKCYFSIIFYLSLIFCLIPAVTSIAADAGKAELKIAIKQFPPFVFKDELKGFCIDMADIICAKHNLTPIYIRYESVPQVLAAVESGECDLAFSGITITADREKRVDFSHPFFDSGLMIAIRSEPGSQTAYIAKLLLKVIGLSLVILFFGLTVVAHLVV